MDEGTDFNEAFSDEVEAINRAISPKDILKLSVDIPGVGMVVDNLYDILRTKDTDDPHEIAASMAYAPVWQAYFGSLAAAADADAADAERDYDEWYALAYEVAKKKLNICKEPGEKIITTDIKQTIPWMFSQEGVWEIDGPDGTYEITLSAYRDILARKRNATKTAALMKTYNKSIESQIKLLPSQLALAKLGLTNPHMSVPVSDDESE